MDKYRNKYRIESARAQWWDYKQSGIYFITICTRQREHYFGEIVNGQMKLSSIGIIANILWYEITQHATDIELGEFIVMPNHIHGILILSPNDNNNDNNVETRHALSQTKPTLISKEIPLQSSPSRFQNQGKNTVSSIIGGYKSVVTKHVRRLGFEFAWQTRFHDHIIRNDQSFRRISEYIVDNPARWESDCFY